MDALINLVEVAITWCTPYIKGLALMATFIGLAIHFGRQANPHPLNGKRVRLTNMSFASLLGGLLLFIGQAVIWDYFKENSPYHMAVLITSGMCFGIVVVVLAFIIAHSLSWSRHILFLVSLANLFVMASMLLDYAVVTKLMSISQGLLDGIEVAAFIAVAVCIGLSGLEHNERPRRKTREQKTVDAP